jgi:hypothetical protein
MQGHIIDNKGTVGRLSSRLFNNMTVDSKRNGFEA